MKRAAIALAVAGVLSTPAHAGDSTIYLLGGEAVSNSISDQHSHAWQIEQQITFPLGTWQFGYLNEGHQQDPTSGRTNKRDGIYALYRFSYMFTDHVETSFSAGPYFAATTVTESDCIHYRDTYRLDGLAGVGVRYLFNKNWSAQFRWEHVIFANSKDSDVFVVGVGFQP